jgi:peptidyl-prolyl cis-trans isomerase D
MLQAIRNRASGFLTRLLFVALIASFALWGIADVFRSGFGQVTVAKVGKQRIHLDEFRQSLEVEIGRMQANSAQPISMKILKEQGQLAEVANAMLERSIMSAYSQHLGLNTDPASVASAILQQSGLKDASGNFDHAKLLEGLARLKMTEADYAAEVSRQLSVSRLYQAVGTVLHLPAPLLRGIAAGEFQQRKIDYVQLPVASLKIAEPSEADLQAYYQANLNMFLERDYRSLSVVSFDAPSIAERLPVTDQAIAEAYQQALPSYQIPEQRVVTQLLFADEAKARQAYDQLQANNRKPTASEVEKWGGIQNDLGAVGRADLPAELADRVFADAVGWREPIKSPLGWHVVRVESINPPRTRALAEVRQQLRDIIALRDANRLLSELQTKVEDSLAGGGNLEEVAKLTAQPIKKIAAVDRWGQDAASKDIAGLPNTPAIRDAIFATDVGKLGNLMTLDNGGFLLFRVDQETPVQPKSFASVRAQVQRAVVLKRQQDTGSAKLAQLQKKAQENGASLAAVATAEGLSVRTSDWFAQEDNPLKLPPSVLIKLFQSPKQAILTGQDAEKLWLVQLSDFREFTPDPNAPLSRSYEQLRTGLTESLQADVLDALQKDVRTSLKVKINQSAIMGLY